MREACKSRKALGDTKAFMLQNPGILTNNAIPIRRTSWARLKLSCHIQHRMGGFPVAALNKCVKDFDHECDEDSAVAAMLLIVDTS